VPALRVEHRHSRLLPPTGRALGMGSFGNRRHPRAGAQSPLQSLVPLRAADAREAASIQKRSLAPVAHPLSRCLFLVSLFALSVRHSFSARQNALLASFAFMWKSQSSSADFATPARGTAPPATHPGGNLVSGASHLGGAGGRGHHDEEDDEDLVLKVTAATAVASLVNAATTSTTAAASSASGSGKNTVTPSSSASSASPFPPDSHEGNKTVRFEQGAGAVAAASSSNPSMLPHGDGAAGSCGGIATAARGGGVGLVYSNRGRYVSPARRSSKSPSPAGGSGSAAATTSSSAATSSWKPPPHPENQPQPTSEQPDEPASTPGLETAVTDSPSLEDRHRRGQVRDHHRNCRRA
jgi:hypothetical protein